MFSARICAATLLLYAGPALAQTVFVDQGPDWNGALRTRFYTEDQGSRIMPVAWMRALQAPDGTGFLDDALARYGYLPMTGRDEADIPAGFTLAGEGAGTSIGMTCSACHTRQIDVNGTGYRIDGGPAIVDFQAFLADLDAAVLAVLADETTFAAFAEKVLGGDAPPPDVASLKIELETWSARFHVLIERSLPDPAWGPGRLDAVSMIFNRLAGLDLGAPPTFVIADNIAVADAPTRYPFLWNAGRQDKTQWPGFADNGNDILGLARNLGEVYGVFAEFHPTEQAGYLNRDYITVNSANFTGLGAQEDALWKIGPPRWPWAIDDALADQGQAIYERPTDQGGCTDCHGKKKGAFRSVFHTTWKTPVQDVGTDIRECQILARMVQTGVLEGADVPFTLDKLGAEEPAFKVLAVSVLGGIIQHYTHDFAERDLAATGPVDDRAVLAAADPTGTRGYPAEFESLRGAFGAPEGEPPAAPSCGYEARVLEGIWAAAPYLHNGSIPTLTELLKPSAERVASFKLGPAYDIEAVGLAAEQTEFDHVLETTGCGELASGSSRCGHEYGVTLSDDEKAALLEYLKRL